MNFEQKYEKIKSKVPNFIRLGTDYKRTEIYHYRKKYFCFEIENKEVTTILETKNLKGTYHENSDWFVPVWLL